MLLMELTRKKLAIAAAAVAVLMGGVWLVASRTASPQLSADGIADFKAPPRSPDHSGDINDKMEALQPPTGERPEVKLPPAPPSRGFDAPPTLPTVGTPTAQAVGAGAAEAAQAAQALQNDPVMTHLARYGTPVTKQVMPVGGLTMWTLISKSGKTVKLYTTADGKALVSGVVWNLESGANVSESAALPMPMPGGDPNYAARLPQVVAPAAPTNNLVTGKYSTPSAFDGKAPSQIPEAIKLVDGLAGFKEGKGGPADTLYIIIDPRCPYCRSAYLKTREHVAKGMTIKWIPTAALGRPEQGLPLATTILRSKDPAVLERVLGKHESIATEPAQADVAALNNNLDFMFEAFKQNNEPSPGVPVAFFVDRRSGKARMMMGLSEQAVIDDILGNPKK